MENNEQQVVHFRQRVGGLDWKMISSIDLNDILKNGNINELQEVLDSITFSEITPQQIKVNSVENISKLIQVMQLTIEYLLLYNHSQISVMESLQRKLDKNTQKKNQLEKKNYHLINDIRSYQRQLHILRQSLGNLNLNSTNLNVNDVGVIRKILDKYSYYPKILNPYNDEDYNDHGHRKRKGDDKAVMLENIEKINDKIQKLFLSHENQSQQFFLKMLEDQRHTFTQAIEHLVDTIKVSSKSSDSVKDDKRMIDELKSEIHDLFLKQQFLMQQNQQQQLQLQQQMLSKTSKENNSSRTTESKEDVLKLLNEVKEEMRNNVAILANNTNHNSQTEKESSIMEKRFEALKQRKTAMKMIGVILKHGFLRRLSRFFNRWVQATGEVRVQRSNYSQVSNKNHDIIVQELSTQLRYEQERNVAMEARYHTSIREIEIMNDQLAQLQDQLITLTNKDQENKQLLRQEKEKHVITIAKQNTLISRLESEREMLLQKIAQLELQQQTVTNNTLNSSNASSTGLFKSLKPVKDAQVNTSTHFNQTDNSLSFSNSHSVVNPRTTVDAFVTTIDHNHRNILTNTSEESEENSGTYQDPELLFLEALERIESKAKELHQSDQIQVIEEDRFDMLAKLSVEEELAMRIGQQMS